MSEQKPRAERAVGTRQVVWRASVWEGGTSKNEAEMEPGSTLWVLSTHSRKPPESNLISKECTKSGYAGTRL